MLLTNVPMLHSDELWVILPLPNCEVDLFVCQSSLIWVKKVKVFIFKIGKGNLKKDCHKKRASGLPPPLPPADSGTIYSFSGQSGL